MPVDASIPLAAGNIHAFDPQQTMSLLDFAQSIRQRQQQQQAQNALRGIFANPTSLGPDGQLTPQAITAVSAIDPATGMQLRQQSVMNAMHQSTIDKNRAQLSAADLEQNLKKDEYLQKTVREPALVAYEDAKRRGLSDAAASDVAQTEYTKGLDAAKASGVFHEDEQTQLNPKFDYARVNSRSQSLKDYRAAQEKKEADARADRQEKERERHDLETEKHQSNVDARMERALTMRGGGDDQKLGADDVEFMAKQYLAGDKSVMQNLGRGLQGSKNIVALRREITRQANEEGMSPKDVTSALAEFDGLKAGERTLGTRSANVEMAVNEASQFADLALDASKNASRTGFVPANKALQIWQKGTGDEKISRFVAANTSFINAYARAVNPNGVPTDSDKKHAREMLDTAQTPAQYAAVIDQLQQEMHAAQQSPDKVKKAMRGGDTTRKPAEHPADIQALLKKYGAGDGN